ncbi:MAG: polymerase sigma factor [Acidobacteria bacterium]|nr:polymerase sigma factor [Acidobacteriota bacterium]
MAAASSQEVTQLLRSWHEGDQAALEKLIPLVYSELRRLARCYMRGEREGHLLQTTALINEAFVRLIEWKGVSWQNRAHFFGVSAGLMRRVLVDIARAQHRAKRGGSLSWVTLHEGAIPGGPARDVVAVDDALKSLEALDPRKGRIVELRFFGGLSTEDTAELLGVSTRTVEREWSLAQAWLLRELKHGVGQGESAGRTRTPAP